MNPKSSEILSKWLNGITIYRPKKEKRIFGPPKINKKRVNNKTFVDQLKIFDCFQEKHFEEYKRLNVLARGIIVVFLLLIIVGSFHEYMGITSVLVVILIILILLYVLIPNARGQIKSKLPRL